jgi:hypothetical protein
MNHNNGWYPFEAPDAIAMGQSKAMALTVKWLLHSEVDRLEVSLAFSADAFFFHVNGTQSSFTV